MIAIIAILAAILFPVFSQAKEAAKKTVGVAHMKQMALACTMYAVDTDDVFPLAYRYDALGPAGGFPWSLAVYPYTKSYDMYLSPQGPPNPVENADWKYIWAYGTMPRAALKRLPYYTVGDFPISRSLGVVGVRHDSIMGWGQAGNVWGCWGAYCGLWTGPITVPSKSSTQLDNVAEQILIFDAGEPFGDYATFGAGLELGVCVNGRGGYNPGNASIGGVTPRWSGGPKSCTGWREAGGGGSASIPEAFANRIRQGQANLAFADGHVKSMSATQAYANEPCPDGSGARCMTRFSPNN